MFGKSGIDYLRNLGKYKWNFHKYVKINITKKRSNSKKKSNEKSKMKKEDLIKARIRTMGYARSSNVLTSAVERFKVWTEDRRDWLKLRRKMCLR